MFAGLAVGVIKVLPVLLCIYGTSARFVGHVQEEIETIQKLAVIRQKILNSLPDTIVEKQALPSTQMTPPASLRVNETKYKRVDIRSYSAESPENTTNENIIQFKLQPLSNDDSTQIDSVDLLIRVKYKRRKNKQRSRHLRLPKESFSIDNDSKNKATNNLTGKERKLKKKIKRRRKFLKISLLVSKVKKDETPGDVITSVTLRLKKTKNLKIALPINVIKDSLSLDDTDNMLKFYIQCKGCGRKASLILVHKQRKESKRLNNTNNSSKYLHKRRPILFVKSEVDSTYEAQMQVDV